MRSSDSRPGPHSSVMVAALAASLAAVSAVSAGLPPGLQLSPDPSGVTATLDVAGPVDASGAFFQSLGTNGRSCATCHVEAQAMGLSAKDARARFAETAGQDPLFAPVDGANCPSAQPASAADHSLLLRHGLIRVFLPMPANAQFTLSVVYDPYGCAMVPGLNGAASIVSVYRRPLPTTNLNFLSTIMFDGRETIMPLNSSQTFAENLTTDLTQQALDAITIHAQASQAPTAAQLANIVGFELALFSAQARDEHAGRLRGEGAVGGAGNLAAQAYYPGMNDSLGGDPGGAAFDPDAMTLFSAWLNPSGNRDDAARHAIAAGEQLFDSAPLHITNVRGLNDNAALGNPSTFTGTCTTCHDTPNVGNHSLPLPLDIGTSHSLLPGAESDSNIAAALAELSSPTLPVYLINGCPNPFGAGEPESFYTTDPGKALISGLCSDFNRGKGPVLRGLAARAPYFHNGSAADLHELINFYNQRFQMNLTEEQKQDLVAFLNSL